MEAFYVILGLAIMYLSVHGFILHFTGGAYSTRTGYEKFVTIASGVANALMLLAVMNG